MITENAKIAFAVWRSKLKHPGLFRVIKKCREIEAASELPGLTAHISDLRQRLDAAKPGSLAEKTLKPQLAQAEAHEAEVRSGLEIELSQVWRKADAALILADLRSMAGKIETEKARIISETQRFFAGNGWGELEADAVADASPFYAVCQDYLDRHLLPQIEAFEAVASGSENAFLDRSTSSYVLAGTNWRNAKLP
jgi:hypothetical protein